MPNPISEERLERTGVSVLPASETVIERLVRGDPTALADLYQRSAGLVNGVALRILGNREEAADVVQTVFFQVWRQANRYDPSRGKPEAWLYTLARTRALDRLRRQVKQQAHMAAARLLDSRAPGYVERLAVRQALAGLPAEERVVLELAYYQGLTQKDIADALTEPLRVVRARLRSGLRALKQRLQPLPTIH